MMRTVSETRKNLRFLVLLLFSIIGSHQVVVAAPQPMLPAMMYREEYGPNIPHQMLVEKLTKMVEQKEEKIEKEIKELEEEEMVIRVLTDEKERSQKEEQSEEFLDEQSELLPVPAAVYRKAPLYSEKRNGYITLCHFKICNMGFKRQMQ